MIHVGVYHGCVIFVALYGIPLPFARLTVYAEICNFVSFRQVLYEWFPMHTVPDYQLLCLPCPAHHSILGSIFFQKSVLYIHTYIYTHTSVKCDEGKDQDIMYATD